MLQPDLCATVWYFNAHERLWLAKSFHGRHSQGKVSTEEMVGSPREQDLVRVGPRGPWIPNRSPTHRTSDY